MRGLELRAAMFATLRTKLSVRVQFVRVSCSAMDDDDAMIAPLEEAAGTGKSKCIWKGRKGNTRQK